MSFPKTSVLRLVRCAFFWVSFAILFPAKTSAVQLISLDTVHIPPLSTTLFQWAFDPDSSRAYHRLPFHLGDTTGDDRVAFGPDSAYGLHQSMGFYTTQWAVDDDISLTLPMLDTRGIDDIYFTFNLAALGTDLYEHSDYVSIGISLDGGASYFDQIKVRGSAAGTAAPGWTYSEGIHYSKSFRYAINSSSIYGHQDPTTKDSISGISRITISGIPNSDAMVIKLVFRSSTYQGESYCVDNLTVGGQVDTLTSLPWAGNFLRWNSATSLNAPLEIQGGYLNLPPQDTLRWSGTTTLTGPLYLLSGYLEAPGLVLGRGGSIRFAEDRLITPPTQRLALVDTGHHFIGNPAFFSQIDTLPYCSVWDAAAGRWTRPNGEPHLGRVLYLFPDQVPLSLTAPANTDTTASWRLQWCDTVQGGTSPLAGWNLLSNPTGEGLWWDALCSAPLWPDSLDATYYGWDAQQQQYASYSTRSGGSNRGPWIGPNESFWVRLSHRQDPGVIHLNALQFKGGYKGSGTAGSTLAAPFAQKFTQIDTTHFIFTSTGSPSQVAQSTLYVSSQYHTSFMPCCDHLFMAGRPPFGVKILKAGQVFCRVAHLPMSTNYPLEVVGEGELITSGVPGYFYYPPDLQSSTQPLRLKGNGPHVVYWLSTNHPDGSPVDQQDEALLLELPEHASPIPPGAQGSWDLLGRASEGGSQVTLRWDGEKWVKEVRLVR